MRQWVKLTAAKVQSRLYLELTQIRFQLPMLFLGTNAPKLAQQKTFLAAEYMIAKSGDILAPFRYLESKMSGDGEVCQSPYRICRTSYESVIREIYAKDVDAWHAELQQYIIKWSY
jgi:hypothetical protein